MSSFNNPNTEIGDRSYIVAVLLGIDGSYTLRAVRHPETSVQVYGSSAIGAGPGALERPMRRAAEFIESDVHGLSLTVTLNPREDVAERVARWAYGQWAEDIGVAITWEEQQPDVRAEWLSGAEEAMKG